MYTDYHIHSEFSDDSKTLMEKQIEKAVSLGLEEICFTEHVDYGIKKDWTEDDIEWRGGDGVGTSIDEMDPLTNANYPEYFGKLLRMKKIYGNKITIRNGLEFGVQEHTISQYEKLVEYYGEYLDFILLSFHQVDNKEFWNGEFLKGKTQEEYNIGYYEEMLRVVSRFDNFDVLAHVDLISRYDPEGRFPFEKIKGILTEIFQLIIEKGKGIEINTSSWHYELDDTMPARDILKLYHDLGGKIITMGSDAHKPEYIGDHFEDARNILKEIGFTEIYTFEKHQPIAHEL